MGDEAMPDAAGAPAEPKVVRKRKTHTKSRNGCLRCKRYRYKCDEGKPHCARCVEKEVECQYAGPSPAQTRSASSASHMPEQTRVLGSPDHNPEHFTLQDMDLLRTFVKTTAFTISEDAAIGDIFSSYVVDIAMKQQFVLHAILCLTALHRAATDPSVDAMEIPSLLDVAAEHQTLSRILFHDTIQAVIAENVEAVFVYTGLVSVSIWCKQHPRLRQHYDHELLTQSGWIRTLRGTNDLLGDGRSISEWLKASPLRILIPYEGLFIPPVPEGNDWARQIAWRLDSLKDWLGSRQITQSVYGTPHSSSSDDNIYMAPLDDLRMTLGRLATAQIFLQSESNTALSPADSAVVGEWMEYKVKARPASFCTTWLFHISNEFLDQLDVGTPDAVLLLAYFGVMVHGVKGLWHYEGLGRAIVESCQAQLQSQACYVEYSSWMEWPMEVTK